MKIRKKQSEGIKRQKPLNQPGIERTGEPLHHHAQLNASRGHNQSRRSSRVILSRAAVSIVPDSPVFPRGPLLNGASFPAGDTTLHTISQLLNSPTDSTSFVIRTDQVSVLKIEAIELIACLLGVVNVLVDHECCALRVVGDTLANLPTNPKKIKLICQRRDSRCNERTQMTVPDRPKLAKEVKELLCRYVVASERKSAILLSSRIAMLQEHGGY